MTELRARCGRIYSKNWAPGCEGVNALARDWCTENGWANPPFYLMPVVVEKVLRSGCALTLVAPHWTARPWYWRAAEGCTQHLRLPPTMVRFTAGNRLSPVTKPAWGLDVFRFKARLSSPPPRCALSA